MPQLSNGQTFPHLETPVAGRTALSLPADLHGSYGVVLFYRGAWCPFCNTQLSAFQRSAERLAETGIKVAALSVDDEATTLDLVEKHGLDFPVGFGADADVIADLTGAYLNDDPRYLQSTGFVLDPEGRVLTAVYSSGAIGRLMPDDVIGLVSHAKSQAAA